MGSIPIGVTLQHPFATCGSMSTGFEGIFFGSLRAKSYRSDGRNKLQWSRATADLQEIYKGVTAWRLNFPLQHCLFFGLATPTATRENSVAR